MSRDEKLHDFDPKGMRVLAIDSNPTCLKYLVFVLQKCKYEATGVRDGNQALALLRDNRDKFDLVVIDGVGQNMGVFELLDAINLEINVPVILVSADDRKSSIMRGIEHGARDYLLKPIRVQEIKNIWQHVFRKKINANDIPKQSISRETSEEDEAPSNKLEPETKGDQDNVSEAIEHDSASSSRPKKPRVTWTPELHRKFQDAVQQLGEVVHPKKILEIMKEPEITRNNIASHLQKYRNMLKKQSDIEQSNSSSSVSSSQETRNRSFTRPVLETQNHMGPAELPQFKNLNFSTYVQNTRVPGAYSRPSNLWFDGYVGAGSMPSPFYSSPPLVSCRNPYNYMLTNSFASGKTPFVSNLAPCFDPFTLQKPFLGQQEMQGEAVTDRLDPQDTESLKREPAIVYPNNVEQGPLETALREDGSRQGSGIFVDDELHAIIKSFIEGTSGL